jgi:hypothetical protein
VKKLPTEFSFKPSNFAKRNKQYEYPVHDFPVVRADGLEVADEQLIYSFRKSMLYGTEFNLEQNENIAPLELPYVVEETPKTKLQKNTDVKITKYSNMKAIHQYTLWEANKYDLALAVSLRSDMQPQHSTHKQMTKYYKPKTDKGRNYFEITNAVINKHILEHNLEQERVDMGFSFNYFNIEDIELIDKIHRNTVTAFEQLTISQKQIFVNFIENIYLHTEVLIVDSISSSLIGSSVLYMFGSVEDSIAVNAVINRMGIEERMKNMMQIALLYPQENVCWEM